MGQTKSKYDDAMFFYKPNKNGQCEGIIVIHVDDFLYGDPVILKKSQMKFTESLMCVRIVMFHSNTLELILIQIEFHLPPINKVIWMGLKKLVSRIKRTNRNP